MNATGRPTLRRAAAGLLLAAALAATACGDDGSDDDSATPTETTEQDDTTTTTVAAEGPQEWVDVARGFFDAQWRAAVDADPSYLSEIYTEDCPCWESEVQRIEQLQEAPAGHVLEGQAPQVLAVEVEESEIDVPLEVEDQLPMDPVRTDLIVMNQTPPTRVVDEDGEVLQEFPESDRNCLRWWVVQAGPNGGWRVREQRPADCDEHFGG